MDNCLTAQVAQHVSDDDPPQGRDSALVAAYLSDESRLKGCAEKVFFPQSETDVAAIVRAAAAENQTVTVSGGRTGITGGAVPNGGWLMSTEKMNHVTGLRFDGKRNVFCLSCQPGMTLESLNKMTAAKNFGPLDGWTAESRAALELLREPGEWRFMPDPTETSATIGGMIACNASGARTFCYGPTRRHVRALRIVLAGGFLLQIKRDECRADAGGAFRLVLPDGEKRVGMIPSYRMPAVKNAAGYFAEPGMDLLDLFIGAEGTLGIVTEVELELAQPPEQVLGVIGFFKSEEDALRFVRAVRDGSGGPFLPRLAKKPLAIEYFDYRALNLLRDQKKKVGSSSEIPSLPETAHTAVYIELPTAEADMEEQAGELLELLEGCGSSADTAWTAMSAEETERLKKFRHALPEAINQLIGERAARYHGLTKLGTDFAVPDNRLGDVFVLYRRILDESGLEYVIFGHIGNNHVHANILPRDIDEYGRGKKIYLELAESIVRWGGTVSAEHGIGKLKKPFLELMYGAQGIEEMRRLKRVFDPRGMLNPGNMFSVL